MINETRTQVHARRYLLMHGPGKDQTNLERANMGDGDLPRAEAAAAVPLTNRGYWSARAIHIWQEGAVAATGGCGAASKAWRTLSRARGIGSNAIATSWPAGAVGWYSRQAGVGAHCTASQAMANFRVCLHVEPKLCGYSHGMHALLVSKSPYVAAED